MKKNKKMAKKTSAKKSRPAKASAKKVKASSTRSAGKSKSSSTKPVKKLTGANKAKDFETRANKLILKRKNRGFAPYD